MSEYLCGIDIGGTFTDCVVVDRAGHVVTAKAPSTPDDFARGLEAALAAAAAELGISSGELCRASRLISHGTTVGTNAIIQRRGSTIGLITTRGHNDVIHIMRGSRGLDGSEVRRIVHFPESSKPDPIVPKRLIEGVSERVDCFGRIVVELNEAEAEEAVRRLRDAGVDAIAVCFLWSFLDPSHERRVKEIAASIAPELFVTCSHELVPKWGEYERTTATCLNAYIGPVTTGYLGRVERSLRATGYAHPLQITQCAGGTISVASAMEAPLLTLDSGPVAGVMGSRYTGELLGHEHVITTDMGGTSFDVGVIRGGEPAFSFKSNVKQYEYYLPKVDIQTVGSGGGSMVRIDDTTATLRVGPESAGADPGPACYGRGGTVPTVTDADLLLGYLDPDTFAGGKMHLDRDAARDALGPVAERLGMDLHECASGVARIVEFQMADLIRKVTIQKGFDPRDFVLFAFGGAGPVHAGVFARELGVAKVIVPQRATASVWCAFGAASADILHIYEQVDIMVSPFEADRINAGLAGLRARADAQLDEDGVSAHDRGYAYSLDMRHRGQIHEVEVELDGDSLSPSDFDSLGARFVQRYERLYGAGASLPGAQLELVTMRCRASAATPKPEQAASAEWTETVPEAARLRPRPVYWIERGGFAETPIWDGHALVAGNRVEGPAVVELATTTVVIHPGQRLTMDAYGNFDIDLEPHPAGGTGP